MPSLCVLLNCGDSVIGYMSAHVFTKLEINYCLLLQVELRTTDGLVKERTQCAPNGYYFIPVYDKVFSLLLPVPLVVFISNCVAYSYMTVIWFHFQLNFKMNY